QIAGEEDCPGDDDMPVRKRMADGRSHGWTVLKVAACAARGILICWCMSWTPKNGQWFVLTINESTLSLTSTQFDHEVFPFATASRAYSFGNIRRRMCTR
ncbi:MAG TPA: hypothetical protein VK976_00055, partial [Verrucomicrobiae bacterium]|nr:hypothetical protein [Verrucomicrobiae bacterium]